MSTLGFQRGTLIGTGWPDGVCLEIKEAIERRQMTSPITTAILKNLVRRGRWADIGKIFDFEPRYFQIGGKVYFNWASCPPEFWALFDPRRYGQKRIAAPSPIVRLKSPVNAASSHKVIAGQTPATVASLFRVQGGLCYYCEQPTLPAHWSIDHKTPRSRGGNNAKSNKVGSCKACNSMKSCLTEEEFRSTPPNERKALIRKISSELPGKIVKVSIKRSWP